LPPRTCSVARSRPGTVRGVEPNWAGTLLHHSTLPHLPRHKFNSHSTILTICLGHCSTTEWVPDSTNQWCVGLEAVEPAAIHCRRELCAEARPRSNLFWTNSSPLPRPHSTYCIAHHCHRRTINGAMVLTFETGRTCAVFDNPPGSKFMEILKV
jgi:hypothetical protein